MNHRHVNQKCYDYNLRVDKIFHLAGMCAQEAIPCDLRDAIMDDWEEIWKIIGIKAPEDETILDAFDTIMDNNIYGFLVQISTPCLTFNESGGCSYSWGWTTLEWFYAETLDEIYEAAEKWQAEYEEEERKKQLG